MEEEIVCEVCETEFTISHEEEENKLAYCPFCGNSLDEEEDEDVYWDSNPNPYGDSDD